MTVRPRRGTGTAAVLAVTFLVAASAVAQQPMQRVLELNRVAMDQYNNLEIEQARDKLQQAIQLGQEHGIPAQVMARIYVNLGVVHVGGLGDNGSGLNYFVSALKADPTVELDPLTSTPEVRTVFTLAQQRVSSGGGGGGGGGQGGGRAAPAASGSSGAPGEVEGNIPHVPVPEQLINTAVPVFVEVPQEAPVAQVQLHYKGLGMQDYRRVEMRKMRGGYGFEIPCADVFEPQVEYYVVAVGEDGAPLGYAGTRENPVRVPIVSNRSFPPPALPGRAPAEQCTEEECPPGMPGCRDNEGGGGGGESGGGRCFSSSDCEDGLWCEDGQCIADDMEDEEEEDSGPGEPPRFFLHGGGALGLAFVQPGMRSDGIPEDMSTRDGGVYILEGTDADCRDNADGFDDYCVRVNQAGFVPTGALRLAVGYYVTERVALAATVRMQPNAGQGQSAGLLLGGRAQYLVTEPSEEGVQVAPFVAAGTGQIQAQPDQNGQAQPYIRSGLGSVSAGTVILYRFMRNVGIHLSPEVHVMFPLLLFNIDVAGGLEVGF